MITKQQLQLAFSDEKFVRLLTEAILVHFGSESRLMPRHVSLHLDLLRSFETACLDFIETETLFSPNTIRNLFLEFVYIL